MVAEVGVERPVVAVASQGEHRVGDLGGAGGDDRPVRLGDQRGDGIVAAGEIGGDPAVGPVAAVVAEQRAHVRGASRPGQGCHRDGE